MTRPAADTDEPNTPIGRIRVLVVDDDPQVGSRLRDLLTDFDHTVVGLASNSIQALVLIKTLHPDVVVTDLRMPGMSGLQLAAEVGKFADPPAVIIVSAYDDASLKEEASQAGAHAYVVKGAPGEQIHDAVVAAAAARSAR
jgi:DNA-binding NarL/FixJ family response regulator